jgi:hypothetical protein
MNLAKIGLTSVLNG